MYVVQAATVTTTPVLTQLASGIRPELFGLISTYAESATFFVKFWWQGNTNAPPIIGTTVPNLTVPISSGAPGFLIGGGTGCGIIMQGPLWWSATLNAISTDVTALGTGGDVITFFLG